MLFINREDAGKRLAKALSKYEGSSAIVVALPRGGVVVGYYVAKELQLPLDIVCPRKLGAPENPEYAIGVVTEDGAIIRTAKHPADLDAIAKREVVVAQERLREYRTGMPPRNFKGRIVILVDDGLATGSTMLGAIETVKEAKKIILAIPVAPPDTLKKFAKKVDEVICLESPTPFYAVGQFYKEFDQVSDVEVKELMRKTFSQL